MSDSVVSGGNVPFEVPFDYVDVADCDGFSDEAPSGMDLKPSATKSDVEAIIREAMSQMANSGSGVAVLKPKHPPNPVYKLYVPDEDFTSRLTHYHLVVYARNGGLWAVQMAVDKVVGRSIESFEFNLQELADSLDG